MYAKISFNSPFSFPFSFPHHQWLILGRFNAFSGIQPYITPTQHPLITPTPYFQAKKSRFSGEHHPHAIPFTSFFAISRIITCLLVSSIHFFSFIASLLIYLSHFFFFFSPYHLSNNLFYYLFFGILISLSAYFITILLYYPFFFSLITISISYYYPFFLLFRFFLS